MRAMVLDAPGEPLRAADVERPEPGDGQLLIRVEACGVCRTDLHLLDGEIDVAETPRILGHQIVGVVEPGGEGSAPRASTLKGTPPPGRAFPERVGVPWLGWTCGECRFCLAGRENLCSRALFTGRDIDGGFAEWAVADERYCFPVPGDQPASQVAPLLCAGLIGHRALRMAGDAERLGLYGFGAAAHIVCQVAVHEGRRVFAFTRAGDADAQALACALGAEWAGDAAGLPPEPLDAAILFAPVGEHVPAALRAVEPGGTVVCAGIHMSDIPSFPYDLLWGERTLRSVANLTRADGEAFLALAPRVPVTTHVTTYPLERANEALGDLRSGRLTGAAVVVPG
jgi:propanol-preferring alcohol dehydrogenase